METLYDAYHVFQRSTHIIQFVVLYRYNHTYTEYCMVIGLNDDLVPAVLAGELNTRQKSKTCMLDM